MRSSGINVLHGVMMTLLLALLTGLVWLTLNSQPLASSLRIETKSTNPILPTGTAILLQEEPPQVALSQQQNESAALVATPTPFLEPTQTALPLPTNTNTLEPTATPTFVPTPSPTALSLPLPTPQKNTQMQPGWQVLTLGASVSALASDRNGFVWLGTKNSVTQQDPNNVQISWNFAASDLGFNELGIASILADSGGGVWVAGGGAAYFNGLISRTFTISDGLAPGTVQIIAEDSQKRVWLGSSGGLSIWNGASFFSLNKQNGLPNDDITALLSDGPRMWIGTNGGGVFRFENNQLQVFNNDNIGLQSNMISALGKLPDGTLLIGSDQGLMTFSGGRAEEVTDVPRNRVTSIVPALASGVWVGTDGGGLHHFAAGRWSRLMDNSNLPDAHISALTVDSFAALWIATADGRLTRYLAPEK